MTVIDPALINEAQELLDRARLIAEAPAAQISAEIGHGHPQSQMPPGLQFSKAGMLYRNSTSTLQACGERIQRAELADSDDAMREALAAIKEEIDLLQLGAPNRFAETRDDQKDRVLNEYVGLAIPEVIRRENGQVSAQTVRNWRVADGRDARLGRKAAQ